MDPNEKKQASSEAVQANSEKLQASQSIEIITDYLNTNGASKQSQDIAIIAINGIDALKESLVDIKQDELAINDHIYAEKNKLKPVNELDYWDDKKFTTPEAIKIYTELRNNGLSHQEIAELSVKSRTEDFQSYLKNKIVSEQNEIKQAVESTKTKINNINKSVSDFFIENKAGPNRTQTPSIFIGRYSRAVLSAATMDASTDRGAYHPDPDATTLNVSKDDIIDGHLSEDFLHAFRHEQVHAYAGGFAQKTKPFEVEYARKVRAGFVRKYNNEDIRFFELNEGTTELIARKIAQRSGSKVDIANHPYNQYVDDVEKMLKHFAQKRPNSSEDRELQTLTQRYSSKTGVQDLKRDLESMYGKKVAGVFATSSLEELVKSISEEELSQTKADSKEDKTNKAPAGAPPIITTKKPQGKGARSNQAGKNTDDDGIEIEIETQTENPEIMINSEESPPPEPEEYTQGASPTLQMARRFNTQTIRNRLRLGPRTSPITRSVLRGAGNTAKLAARMATRVAAQAALTASRALLNPWVLGVIIIILLLIVIIMMILGPANKKEPAPLSGSCPPVATASGEINTSAAPVQFRGQSASLTDSQARAQLFSNGFQRDNIKVGVSLEGIKQNTICAIINFRKESGLTNIVITSGTDGRHSTIGQYTHKNGYKLDLRINPQIDSYVRNTYTSAGKRGDGAAKYNDRRGNGFYREIDHWDIAFIGNNCSSIPEDPSLLPSQSSSLSETPSSTPLNCNDLSIASEGATTDDCGGKYRKYMDKNIHDKSNWGDPACDFAPERLKARLEGTLPQETADLFYRVARLESAYIPLNWTNMVGNVKTPDPGGAWGLYQMGSQYGKPNGALDHGDTIWQNQNTNAVGYLRRLKGAGWRYWEAWRRLTGNRTFPI